MPTARRTLILALLLVAAGSLIFTTGAAVIDGDADTVADGDLAVQPADGPNGRYAFLNDDEIAIDVSASNPNIEDPSFEGVNVGATGTIDDVFTITYTGDEYAHVWIGYPTESVTFVADGDSIEGEANNVTLATNQTVTVGLALDTRGAAVGAQLGADEFTINATLAESEETGAMGASTQRAGGGPTTTVTSPSADHREFVASDVDRGGSVQFVADGMHLGGDNVTLDGIDLEGVENEHVELDAEGSADVFENGSAVTAPTTPRSMAYLALEHDFAPDAVDAMTIRFSADRDHLNSTDTDPENVTLYRQTDSGNWTETDASAVADDAVRMRGLSKDRVHFRSTTKEFSTFAVAERVPRFDVTETALDPPAVDPGEEATVRATLRNGGGAAGERTVALTADGEPVASETVALAPNETATVGLADRFETPGEYDFAVAGADAGTLLVGDPTGDDGGAGGQDAGTGTGSVTDGDADGTGDGPGESAEGPTEEPAGVDLAELGGLLALVALALAGTALLRRTALS
ncbi:CARDB domain-containing protein [Halorubrum amylolyticum]|uniref:CARDB domain-containing protein n=1 Tax=Halorubrum amylolyticum TaxID=2508724 RepID=UPI0010086970|nr:CARDB domain-containing protein [Halorubrum amylolyticum]